MRRRQKGIASHEMDAFNKVGASIVKRMRKQIPWAFGLIQDTLLVAGIAIWGVLIAFLVCAVIVGWR